MKLHKFAFGKSSNIVITLVFFLIAVLVGWYAVTVDDEILEATRLKMEDIGMQMCVEIERSVEESEDDLSLLAEYVAEADVTVENAVEFFQSQSQVEEFDNLYYIETSGQGISLTGSMHDFSNNTTFLQALKDEFCIAPPRTFGTSEEAVFDVAVPVEKNGEVTGVLLSEIPISNLYEIMYSTAKGGWVFLIDPDLNIFFTTSLGHNEFDSVPSDDIEMLGTENVAAGVARAQEGLGGSFTYIANYGNGDTQKILVYSPIEMTNWVLAVAIEESAINVDLETAIGHILNISAIILAVITFFIIYIWLYRIYSERELEKIAYYDPLTTLPNLAKLRKHMYETLSKNKKKQYSVVKIDVDNFKAINELFGYDVGNRVLQAFKTVRESVDEPTLQIARTGIDEFILFSGNGFLEDMELRTMNYEALHKKLIPELGNYKVSFNYGRYHITPGDTNIDEIMNKLNLTHKIAKESKGLIIYDYDEAYTKKLLEEANLSNKMYDALHNHEFLPFLQPKFSLQDNKLVGAEALVRWRLSDGAMVFPNHFIPLFERNGFIVNLDHYVLEEVCIQIRKWLDDGLTPIPISVNCSRLNLFVENFIEHIIEIVDKHGVPHELIEIELTETITIENEEIVECLFADLRKNGFKISIDDFGSGYSSLGMLPNMRVDTLKMDRSFFVRNKEVVRAEYVVDGFIKVAHNLDMYVVAEGIETEEQITALKRTSCDAVQGFYYAKPMPSSEFEVKYRNLLN